MLRRGRGQEDETPENGDTVCSGPSAPFVGLGPAFQEQWPQMVAPHKEKSPPEKRTPREAGSPRPETQNSEKEDRRRAPHSPSFWGLRFQRTNSISNFPE